MISGMATLNDRVRERLRDEKDRLKLTREDLGTFCKWTPTKVSQKLNGVSPITVDEMEAFCFAMNLQPTEVVRDRGLEFVAEMTPTELRLLEIIRALPRQAFDGLLHFLQVQQGAEKRQSVKKRLTKTDKRA